MIKEWKKSEAVLFGELHDKSIDHRLELQVTKDLYTSRKLRQNSKIATIHNVEQESIEKLETGYTSSADFIICIPRI